MLPYTYVSDFAKEGADETFARLWAELPWEMREGAPRREYWANDAQLPYTYGSGNGVRTYDAQPWHPLILDIRTRLLAEYGADLNCCFVNGYVDERQALGRHSDNSIEMDDARPIAVVTFGAERLINFYTQGVKGPPIDSLRLQNGSLLLMHAGMQDTHDHSIPKGDRPCGPRLSLTYRGLLV